MASVSFSVGEALGFGWKTFKAHSWLLLAAVIGLFGLTFALQWGLDALLGEKSLLGSLLGMLAGTLSTCCFIGFYLDLLETGTPDFQALFSRLSPKKVINFVLFSMAYAFICMVGFFMLIVPGFVFIAMFSQGGYLIIDRDLNFLQALQESAKMTKGAKVDLFLFGLAGFGLCLLGLIALVVGILVVAIVYGVAQTYIYRQLLPKLDTPDGLELAHS
ncbi:hypothetical protein J7643_10740 [bacterium]|nr:hypothetical protein [bacterium]